MRIWKCCAFRHSKKNPGARPGLSIGIGQSELIGLGVRRCKPVQTTPTDVEVRYIPMNDGVTVDAEAAQRMIDIYVSPKLKAIPVKVSELPPAPNGKYLMHESLI